MKIYNEVTIDMNPESDDYGKHLHEDSIEYEGEVALCGSKPKPINFKGMDAQPGIQAAGLPGGKFPSQLPSNWAGTLGDIHQGEFNPGGVVLGGPKAVDVKAADKSGERWHGMSNVSKPKEFKDSVTAYSEDFKSKWYDPYVKATIEKPLEGIRKKGFEEMTMANTGLTQEVLDMLPKIGSISGGLNAMQQGKLLMPKNVGSELRRSTQDFETAVAERDFNVDKYETDLANFGTEKEKAEKLRLDERRASARERAGMAGGVLGAEEAIRASGAFSGIETSGPRESFISAERGSGQEAFIQSSQADRKTEQEYTKEIEAIDRDTSATQDLLDKEISDFDTITKTGYGRDVADALSAGAGGVDELLESTKLLLDTHQQYGASPGLTATNPSNWKNFESRKNITGYSGFSSPSQGWFSGSGNEFYNPTKNLLNQVKDTSQFFTQGFTGELSDLAPDTDY